jgi:hypothetical protein
LINLVCGDQQLLLYLQPNKLRELMNAHEYVGTARERAGEISEMIKRRLRSEIKKETRCEVSFWLRRFTIGISGWRE